MKTLIIWAQLFFTNLQDNDTLRNKKKSNMLVVLLKRSFALQKLVTKFDKRNDSFQNIIISEAVYNYLNITTICIQSNRAPLTVGFGWLVVLGLTAL